MEKYKIAIVMKGENARIVDTNDAEAMGYAKRAGWQVVLISESPVNPYELMHGFIVESEERYTRLQSRIENAIKSLNGEV